MPFRHGTYAHGQCEQCAANCRVIRNDTRTRSSSTRSRYRIGELIRSEENRFRVNHPRSPMRRGLPEIYEIEARPRRDL